MRLNACCNINIRHSFLKIEINKIHFILHTFVALIHVDFDMITQIFENDLGGMKKTCVSKNVSNKMFGTLHQSV